MSDCDIIIIAFASLFFLSLRSLSLTMAQVRSTWLYQASFMGNTDEVKELMDCGTDVNEPNDVSTILNM